MSKKIMQIWAESGKSALPIYNYSQILYRFLTFTQNLVIQLQKWNATVLLRKSGRLASQYAADDKLDKVLENPQVIKTPVVRNGKQSPWVICRMFGKTGIRG